MIKEIIKSLLIIFSLLSVSNVYAQENNISQLTDKDYFQIQLPPLNELFENAKKSSNVRFFDTRQKANASMLKTEKKDWLKYIKLVGAYQYGVMANSSTLADQNLPQILQISNSKQSWYNVGIAISVPFDDLLDRSNRLQRRKLEAEATAIEMERWYDEQKLRIIALYSKALQFLAILKAKSEAMTLADAQYKIGETDFINGRIDAAALSVRKNIQTDAMVNYENIKSELNTTLLQLEILSNTKIIK